MKVSANEIQSLAAKAARGAGAPPAQAADFGRAALCHLIACRPVEVLADALTVLPEGPIISLPLAFARLIENSEGEPCEGLLQFTADPQLMQSYAEAQPFASETTRQEDGLHVRLLLHRPNPLRRVSRVDLPDGIATNWQVLAKRTFVPETEASRRLGAGAGLTDND